jgi:hypothetical protein
LAGGGGSGERRRESYYTPSPYLSGRCAPHPMCDRTLHHKGERHEENTLLHYKEKSSCSKDTELIRSKARTTAQVNWVDSPLCKPLPRDGLASTITTSRINERQTLRS